MAKASFKDVYWSQFNQLYKVLLQQENVVDLEGIEGIDAAIKQAPESFLHYGYNLENDYNLTLFEEQMQVVNTYEVFVKAIAEDAAINKSMAVYAVALYVLEREGLIEKPTLIFGNLERLPEAQNALKQAYSAVKAAAQQTGKKAPMMGGYRSGDTLSSEEYEEVETSSRTSSHTSSWREAVKPQAVSLNEAMENTKLKKHALEHQLMVTPVEELQVHKHKDKKISGFIGAVSNVFSSGGWHL